MGTVVAKIEEGEDLRKHGYVAMLAVDKGFRRLGIGRTLMTFAISAIQNNGAVDVSLDTEVTNSAAQALYKSLGFQVVATRPQLYSDGTDAYHLLYSLSTAG